MPFCLYLRENEALYKTYIFKSCLTNITDKGHLLPSPGRLKLRNEDERELRGWGGRTVEIPDYSLETSRAEEVDFITL
jgi:hypothetical protein